MPIRSKTPTRRGRGEREREREREREAKRGEREELTEGATWADRSRRRQKADARVEIRIPDNNNGYK